MFVGMFAVLLYILLVVVGIAFMIFVIISLSRLITLKNQQNELLRELLKTLKEKKDIPE